MIDLTPLDVRSKRRDFKKLMRGYDPQEVDGFLEIVAERLEALIRENMSLKERSGALAAQVATQSDREQAVQAALVTAQELRADIRTQAQREADNIVKAAETEGRRLVAEAEAAARTKLRGSERRVDQLADQIQDLERRRMRFLKDFRQLLERELDVVEVESERTPLEERTIDLELGSRREETAEATSTAESTMESSTEPTADSETPAQAAPSSPPVAQPSPVPTIAPDAGPEEVPPPDVAVDELAAAYDRASDAADVVPPRPRPTIDRRHENLLLYLDPDEMERGG